MFIGFDHDIWPRDDGRATSGGEALLLWSIRHMAMAWPRCYVVHVALQQAYGCDGLGVEHMIRCWLVGLSRRSGRRLTFAPPASAMPTADEQAMLASLRHAGDGTGRCAAALAPDAAGDLEPLLAALAALLRR